MSERLVLVQLSSATASGMAPMSAAFVEIQHSQPELLFVVAKDERGRAGLLAAARRRVAGSAALVDSGAVFADEAGGVGAGLEGELEHPERVCAQDLADWRLGAVLM
jgi:hypothetical protein